jgi:cysteine-rich repeat protein
MVESKTKGFLILLFTLSLVLISLEFASACVCDDGVIEGLEECDEGMYNGFLCWASYGSSCTYCTNDCELKTITNYCGDGIKQDCEECDDGNLIDDDACSNSCKRNNPEPTCDHEIAIRYSYSNSYETGIAVGYGNGTWIAGEPANLEEGNYQIKYFIDNLKEADDNVHVIVKLDDLILSEYDDVINAYSSKELDLDTSSLCGVHTLTVEIESDGPECDLTDNYAEREIYVECEEEPYCGDEICNNGETCSSCSGDCGVCPPDCPECPTCPECPPCNECGSCLCGNGIIDAGEQCDDGNLNNFDGCSRLCYIEENYEEEDNNNECDNNRDCENDKDTLFLSSCEPNWKCTGWSECSNGVMTRECNDKNSCDNAYNQPIEQTNCDSPVLSKVYVENNSDKSFWILGGIMLLIILIIILVNLL